MADTSKINATNVGSLSDDEIKGLDPNQLEKVLDLLDDIVRSGDKLKEDQRRVYELASRYHRELEKAGKAIDENSNGFERFGSKVSNINGRISGFVDGLKQIGSSIIKLGEPWGKVDQAAYDFGKTLGGNVAAVERLRDESIKFGAAQHIGIKYNATIGEMIKLQQQLSQTVGRNLQLSNNQRETLLATSKLMGQNTNEFVKKLDNMGVGLERSGDIAAKMFNEASKSGISFEKYSKSVTDNLTKVQSYGFKNGVEGLTAMAKRAVEVNMSINEAFKVADKIQSGGIQEAIKMSAGLQVLGGNLASFGGDPMSMLYEGLNDVGALQDRMIKMFSGNASIVNGEVKISAADRLRMNAAAQSLGVSSDEMFNMVSRGAVRDRIVQQMGSRFNGDEELKELIANTATLNKEGQAVVNINGQQKTLDQVSSADTQYLKDIQKSESEDIKDIAQMMRGYMDIQSGSGKEMENQKANMFKGIGGFVKNIAAKTGEITWLLHTLITLQAVSSIAGTVGGGVRRMGSAVNRGGKGVGKAGSAPKGSVMKYGGGERAFTRFATKIGGKTGLKAAQGIAKFAGSTAGKMLGGGALGGAMTGIGYLADGSFKGNQSQNTKAWSGTIGSALLGGIGTAIGGPIVGMIGAKLGEIAGELVAKGIDKGRANNKKELTKELKGVKGKNGEDVSDAFASLSDNYSRRQLKKIKKALADGEITEDEMNKFSKRTRKKMAQNDKDLIEKFGSNQAKARINKDIEEINAKIESGNFNMETGEFNIGSANLPIEPVAMATGGKLNGPSDINGPGMPIQGTNIVVGGGEYVVNAEATKKNEDLLDRINSGASFKMAAGGIMPAPVIKFDKGGKLAENIGNPGWDKKIQMPIKISNILPNILKSPLAPLPVRATMSAADRLKQNAGGIGKMEVAPIKLDVSGTIKLDAGGQQVDLNAIINNPAFLTQLSQMVERRLADNINGGNFKELRKNKQHTF